MTGKTRLHVFVEAQQVTMSATVFHITVPKDKQQVNASIQLQLPFLFINTVLF